MLLRTDLAILKRIKKESPEAYFEWTLNGLFIKPEPGYLSFSGKNIMLKNAKKKYSGLYVCVLFRINKKRVVLRVISVAVRSRKFDYDTRATRDLTITCNAVILGN